MISYTYLDGYLYIHGETKIQEVRVDAVYYNPNLIFEARNEDLGIGYENDMEFPIPGDLLSAVKKTLLSGELSIADDNVRVERDDVDNS